MRLTGLRGVGKTVLLGEFSQVARGLDWATAFLELQPGHNSEDAVSAALVAASKAAREEVSRVEKLKAAVGGVARKAGTLGIEWGEFSSKRHAPRYIAGSISISTIRAWRR
jgi:hypothetical protein